MSYKRIWFLWWTNYWYNMFKMLPFMFIQHWTLSATLLQAIWHISTLISENSSEIVCFNSGTVFGLSLSARSFSTPPKKMPGSFRSGDHDGYSIASHCPIHLSLKTKRMALLRHFVCIQFNYKRLYCINIVYFLLQRHFLLVAFSTIVVNN